MNKQRFPARIFMDEYYVNKPMRLQERMDGTRCPEYEINGNKNQEYVHIEEFKALEDKYRFVCKSCNGVGEIGHQLRDGTWENDTCPHCVGYVEERVWNEAIQFIFGQVDLIEPHNTRHIFSEYQINLLKEEGKRRGYVK